jgi:phosphate transport system substrate-binding protein
VGKAKSSRGDFTASEDDNTIVQGVSRDKGALGYLGFAYYQSNQDKLKALAIRDKGAKRAVTPSFESVLSGSYTPLSRPIFIYVNLNSLIQKEQVDIFARFYLDQAKVLAKEIQYVPLNDTLYDALKGRLTKRQVGTNFINRTHHNKKISLEILVQNEPEL